MAAVLHAHAIEGRVVHVVGEGHGALAQVQRPVVPRRTHAQREVGIAPRRSTIAQVEGERHVDAVERDVQVGIQRVGQLGTPVAAHGRVVEGVLCADGASDDERVALRNLVDALGKGPSHPTQGRYVERQHQHCQPEHCPGSDSSVLRTIVCMPYHIVGV